MLESAWGLRRPVAVKVIAMTQDMDDGEAMRHLGRVARRAVCVRDPSVIQLFEVDRADGRAAPLPHPFIVMELVEGASLASLMRGWGRAGRRVPVDFATTVALRAAEALDAALFTIGPDGALTRLVHGGLSPRQILVSDEGEVKVGDFGEFTLTSNDSHVRERGDIAHTAPEIACGETPNMTSDVFSLGILLHQLLVGPRFAKGTTIADAARMVRKGQIHSHIFAPNLPRALRDVIHRATDPNPTDRYPHARAMAFDLRREMLRLGLTETRTCVRHTVIGWFDEHDPRAPRSSRVVRDEDLQPLREIRSPFTRDTAPTALRARR